MPDADRTVTRPHTYDREAMAERGRRGGLTKAANRRAVPVELTGGELSALTEAYQLLRQISERAKQPAPSPDTLPTPPDSTGQAA